MAKMEVEPSIRTALRQICTKFGDRYWRKLDRERAYPEEFANELEWAHASLVAEPVLQGARFSKLELEAVYRPGIRIQAGSCRARESVRTGRNDRDDPPPNEMARKRGHFPQTLATCATRGQADRKSWADEKAPMSVAVI